MIGDNDNNNANRQHNEVMGQNMPYFLKKCLFNIMCCFTCYVFLNSKLCIVCSMQQTKKKVVKPFRSTQLDFSCHYDMNEEQFIRAHFSVSSLLT